MIYLGHSSAAKGSTIVDYCAKHAIRKVFFLSPKRFEFPLSFANHKTVDWPEIIKYRTFYPLLQEIDNDCLIVVNECLRMQNRHDLTYNCIRQFIGQTKHVLVFQTLPLIDEPQDFMILFDFVTRSKWKREKFDADLVKSETQISVEPLTPAFREIPVAVDSKVQKQYAATKQKLFADLGMKDPHTIPRNLYLIGGKAKAEVMEPERQYVGRNNRIGAANLHTYTEDVHPASVFEFPHNFINFSDFVTVSRQTQFDVMRADLKVDQWYFARYTQWAERVASAYAALQ